MDSDADDDSDGAYPFIRVFDVSERRTKDAYFWESLREEVPAWKDLEYEWIASSCFGDQVIVTDNSPVHPGETAVYIHGPDVAGPRSPDPNWIDNILYLGPSESEWLTRLDQFGDEYSVAPGSIDESLDDPEGYREIYRRLNPGLTW